jgi:hypothetical protein
LGEGVLRVGSEQCLGSGSLEPRLERLVWELAAELSYAKSVDWLLVKLDSFAAGLRGHVGSEPGLEEVLGRMLACGGAAGR